MAARVSIPFRCEAKWMDRYTEDLPFQLPFGREHLVFADDLTRSFGSLNRNDAKMGHPFGEFPHPIWRHHKNVVSFSFSKDSGSLARLTLERAIWYHHEGWKNVPSLGPQ